jgi:two-component system sensor histidine kinase KdpD
VTGLSIFINPIIGYRAIGYLYLLNVIAIGFTCTLGPIILSSLLASLSWNFFFIAPHFTLHVRDIEDQMMLLAFIFVGLLSGVLARQLKNREEILSKNEYNSKILFNLLENYYKANSVNEIYNEVEKTIFDLFSLKAIIFICEEPGVFPEKSLSSQSVSAQELAIAKLSFNNNKKSGWATSLFPDAKCLALPIESSHKVIGVALLFPENYHNDIGISEEILILNILKQMFTALEHFQTIKKKQEFEYLKTSEKLHQTLLNSISHEMRIPITSIAGSVSALQNAEIMIDETKTKILHKNIIDSCQRLNQVVENLLDMSRLESGLLQLKKEWIEVEELITNASKLLQGLPQHNQIKKNISSDLLVFCDIRLLEHALFNLLLNAAKYSPANSTIEIIIERIDDDISFKIIDEGPGIPAFELSNIFQKFYQLKEQSHKGLGLGLSIVKGIAELHNGSIKASNRIDQSGAIFDLRIPWRESNLPKMED